MSAHLLSDTHYALNLNWLPPGLVAAGARESKKIKELLALKSQPAGYAELTSRIGLQLGATHDADDIGLASAAALFAQSQPLAILVERIEPNLFWLCVTEEGSIFPAGDLVGNRDLISARLAEVIADFSGREVHIFDRHQDFFDEKESIARDFSELTSEILASEENQCRPIQARSYKKPLVALAACALLALVGYGTWSLLPLLGEDQEALRAQRLEAQKAARLQQERQAVIDALTQNTPFLLASFGDLIVSRPLRLGGWRLRKYEWKDGQVIATWQREHGRIADLLEQLGHNQFEFDEKTGDVLERLELPTELDAQPAELEPQLGRTSERHLMFDRLAAMPGTWSMAPATVTGTEYPVRTSQIHGSSNRLSQLFQTAALLQRSPLTVSALTSELPPKLKWKLTATYYEFSN